MGSATGALRAGLDQPFEERHRALLLRVVTDVTVGDDLDASAAGDGRGVDGEPDLERKGGGDDPLRFLPASLLLRAVIALARAAHVVKYAQSESPPPSHYATARRIRVILARGWNIRVAHPVPR